MLDRAFALTEGLRARDAVVRLMEILKIVRIYGLQRHVSFDFGMLSAYTYYTGVIFRGYTYGSGDAVVKGGRYDTLLGHFGKNAPSAGFVVVLGNLMNALQRQKIGASVETGRTLLTICLYRLRKREEAHRMAATLRAEGKCAELVLAEAESLRKTDTGIDTRTRRSAEDYPQRNYEISDICTDKRAPGEADHEPHGTDRNIL